jgi:L-galactose dehydrogenase/L-glyceraldehyde 3-phosphate reductase
MRYRKLGRTKLRVSEIGFGCGNVGGLMIRGSHEDQIQGVNRAIELGINYFDTAQRYGNGLSETNLGQVLHELQPKDVIVATKVRIQHEDLLDIRSAVQRSLKKSLSRLNRRSVDVFQLHTQVALTRGGLRPETLGVDDVIGAGGVADAFDEVRQQGLVSFIGFTGLGEPEALHKVIASGRFDVVQTYYNLLNPSAGFSVPTKFVGTNFQQLIQKASEQNMGIVGIRVLAGGALGGAVARQGYAASNLGRALTKGSDYEVDVERIRKIRFLVSGEIRSLPEAGIRFVLMNKDVSIVLVGFSNTDQIEEAAGGSIKGPLPKNLIDELQDLWATDFGKKTMRRCSAS